MTGGRLRVDGEDDGGHPALSVVLGDLVDRRMRVDCLEILGFGRLQLRTERGVPVSGDLRVRVDVDRDEVVDLHGLISGMRGTAMPTVSLAAVLWVAGIGARVAFSLWVSHGGAPSIRSFSIAPHQRRPRMVDGIHPDGDHRGETTGEAASR